MVTDELSDKQKEAILDQIRISAEITIGVTLIAIGASIILAQTALALNDFLRNMFIAAFMVYIIVGAIVMYKGIHKANTKYGTKKVKPTASKTKEESES